MNAKLIAGVVLLVVGAILLWQGWEAKQSVGSRISETLTGNPSDQALWYLIGGAVAAVVGIGLIALQARR